MNWFENWLKEKFESYYFKIAEPNYCLKNSKSATESYSISYKCS